ncbi:ATP-binding cassette domain-containing protein [Paenibacillus septentrionalis]|uniref:Nickel import system ATP-binding protein NikD n=1 Tax=Paenibacillus septentrionalis TaxID=429342 RepID=A0ABW1V3Z6_9BACL
MALLDVHHLSISFTIHDHKLREQVLNVIDDLSLSIESGEIVAVVGASGSGKSLLAHAILGLLPSNAKVNGELLFEGEPLSSERLHELRGTELALIPQSVQYLNPLMRVGKQVEQAVRIGDPKKVRRHIFQRFKLAEETAELYPYQLSGGMARRVLVSIAAGSGAKLLIADEPTPGLDEGVIQQTLHYFQELVEAGSSIMLITHDLAQAAAVADRVAVLLDGKLVEVAPASSFSGEGNLLEHPYARALWQALPQHQFIEGKRSQHEA